MFYSFPKSLPTPVTSLGLLADFRSGRADGVPRRQRPASPEPSPASRARRASRRGWEARTGFADLFPPRHLARTAQVSEQDLPPQGRPVKEASRRTMVAVSTACAPTTVMASTSFFQPWLGYQKMGIFSDRTRHRVWRRTCVCRPFHSLPPVGRSCLRGCLSRALPSALGVSMANCEDFLLMGASRPCCSIYAAPLSHVQRPQDTTEMPRAAGSWSGSLCPQSPPGTFPARAPSAALGRAAALERLQVLVALHLELHLILESQKN